MRIIAFSLLVTTFVGLIGLGWAVDWLYSHYNTDVKSTDTSHYEQLGQQLAGTLDNLDALDSYISDWNRDGFSRISLVLREDIAFPDALLNKLKKGESLTLQSPVSLAIYSYLPKHEVFMLFSSTGLSTTENEHSGSSVFTLIFYSGVLIFLLIWLYPLVSRLTMMNRLTQRLGRGDLSVRMPPSAFSYIQTIENEFNRMAVSIENLVADNKLLSSAVSHDLRTPLARIRFGVDTLSETDDQSEKDEHIEHLNQDIDEMESLVGVLLDYSKMSHNSFLVEKTSIDFVCLVSGCLDQVRGSQSHLIYTAPEGSIFVEGIEPRLRMLINNLIQNALRYGENTVKVTLESSVSHVLFIVEDDGFGIPEKERAQVLKPFIRGIHKSASGQGHGMGLAIVDRVVQSHNGTLAIEDSTALGGAKLSVSLPLS